MSRTEQHRSDFDLGSWWLFTGVFAVVWAGLIAYALLIGMPHGPIPLVASLFWVCAYESPIIDEWKRGLF